MDQEIIVLLNEKVKALSIYSDEDFDKRVETARFIIDELVHKMCEVDPLFENIYLELGYTGSFYEKLKINQANEFDINLKLRLPFDIKQFQVLHRHQPHGFAKYKLLKPLHDLNLEDAKVYEELFDEDLIYISRSSVNRWLQSVVDRALNTGYFPQILRVSHTAPATTISITIDDGSLISVDLVPVIQLQHIPRSARTSVLKLPIQERKSCLVPKPPPLYCISEEPDYLFRVSLPDNEKRRTKVPGCFKPVIRIFKNIRDDLELNCDFNSYMIKTFFFWEWEKRPSVKFWEQKNLENVFQKSLEDFIMVLENKRLPHIIFPKFNLLEDIDDDILSQFKSKCSSILKSSKCKRNRLEKTKILLGL